MVIFCLLFSSCDPETARRAALSAELKNVFEKNSEYASDGFDFPVGPPNGRGYYVARGFGELGHLGEDWNGVGGGDTDRGDPICAAAAGYVVYADEYGGGWGGVIRIVHRLPPAPGKTPETKYVETLYAHSLEMKVKKDDLVRRGQVIGTMGDAGGLYYVHLHFELRTDIFLTIGHGYGEDAGYVTPTAFIKTHRPKNDPGKTTKPVMGND